MTELAEAYRIAPKTGYKWVNRHAKGGVLAFAHLRAARTAVHMPRRPT